MKHLSAKLIIAAASSVAFFLVLEGGLRLGGFGESYDFFIPEPKYGAYRTNPRFGELFFPPSFGLKPVNYRLKKQKEAGTYRVFVLGESAAMGVPEPAFSISELLRLQLEHTIKDKTIEVYNCGMTAINSHAILQIARQVVRFSPDLLVLYMGNNEVVGPFGPSSSTGGIMPARWLIELSLWVRGTRTGQFIQRILSSLKPLGHGFKDWRGMELFSRNAVSANDPRLAAVYANFAANLDDILLLAQKAGTRVLLSTVAVNVRDCAPFISQHSSELNGMQIEAWKKYSDHAEHSAILGKLADASQEYRMALKADPTYADVHFRLARVLDKMGNVSEARVHYLQALQLDCLRFRADARINRIIRNEAQAHASNVTLIDSAKELGSDASSTSSIAGSNLFLEHVHLNWNGNNAVARLLTPPAARALGVDYRQSDLCLPSDQCAKLLAYTRLGRLEMLQTIAALTARPPFTGQSSFAENRTAILAEIAATKHELDAVGEVNRAIAALDAALQRDSENPFHAFQCAAARLQIGEFDATLNYNERATEIVPMSPELAAQRAFALWKLGETKESERVLLHSADLDPYYFQTYGLLGEIWVATNQLRKAAEFFSKLVANMPDSRGARIMYGRILALLGDWKAAEVQFSEVLRTMPDDQTALDALAGRFRATGNSAAILKLLLAAYAYNPRNFDVNSRLAQYYMATGDTRSAVKYLKSLALSGPVNAKLYLDLAALERALGHPDEADIALVKAKLAADAERDPETLQAPKQGAHAAEVSEKGQAAEIDVPPSKPPP